MSRREEYGAPPARVRATQWLVPACLVAVMLTGGGSALYPRLRLVAELFGLLVLFVALTRARWRTLWQSDRLAMVIAVTLIGLILLQLLPLPVAIWSALPGRALSVSGDELMFGSLPRRALDLDPEGGIRASLTLVPAFAVYLYARHADATERWRVSAALIGGAMLSLLLGLLQSVSGQAQATHLFTDAQSHLSTGLFANRNHQAVLMAVSVPLLATAVATSRLADRLTRGQRIGAFALAGASLTVGALLTASRTGAVLLLPAWVGGLLIVAGPHRSDRRTLAWGAAAFVALASILVAGMAGSGGPLAGLANRSVGVDDPRWRYWPQALVVLRQYWPAGSGFGTFRAVYDAAEPLPILGTLYVNHVHNDWIEVLLEGGVAAALLLVLFLGWFAIATWRAWRRPPEAALASFGRAGSVVVACLLLHSVVDYPLRTVTLATVFGFALAGLSPAVATDKRPHRWRRRGAAFVVTVMLGWFVLMSNLGAYLARTDRPQLGIRLTAAGGAPTAFYAMLLARLGEKNETVTFPAARAVLASPIHWRAFRAAELAIDDPELRGRLRAHALAWTRRDPTLLLETFRADLASGDANGAVDALDAYLRLPGADDRVRIFALVQARDPRFAAVLARHLAQRPGWRLGLLQQLSADPRDRAANAALWQRLAAVGAPVGRDEAAVLLARYGGGDGAARSAGFALWLTHFAAGRNPAALPEGTPLPAYDWAVAPGMESHVGLLNGRMDIDLIGDSTQVIAQKTVALPAATFRLAVRGEPSLLSGLFWSLTCEGAGPEPRPLTAPIATPACPVQTLALHATAGSGTISRIELVRVR